MPRSRDQGPVAGVAAAWPTLAGRVRVSASPLLWLSLVALALGVTGLATLHHRDIG